MDVLPVRTSTKVTVQGPLCLEAWYLSVSHAHLPRKQLQDSDESLDAGSFLPIDVAERPKGAAARASFSEQPQLAPPTACVFSSVLGETHNRTSGFKELFRRLEPLFSDRRKIESKLRDGPSGFSSISKALAADSGTALLVIGNPTKPLSPSEQQKLVDYIVDGGHLIVAAGEGGFQGSNIDDVLQLFGITARSDSVLRCMLHKYYHPKEAIIPDGVVNRALAPGPVANDAGKTSISVSTSLSFPAQFQ